MRLVLSPVASSPVGCLVLRKARLLTTCYFPLTTRYLLLTTASSCARRDYLLLAIYYLLLAIDYLLLTTYYCLVLHKARLLTTCYLLFTTCYLLLTTASPYTRRDTGSRPRQLPPPRQRLSTTAGSRRALTTHCAHHAHYYPCPLLTLLTMITCQMITSACPLYTHYAHAHYARTAHFACCAHYTLTILTTFTVLTVLTVRVIH